MKGTFVITSVLLLRTGATALSQAPPDPAPAIEALKGVAFLEGTWSGEGWSQMGSGPKEEFTVTETVEVKLGGAVMLIEGVGRSKDDKARIGHHALAVIAFDPGAQKLLFSSFIAGRPRQDRPLEVGQESIVRGFSLPDGGRVRYTISVQGDVWHEIGEYSRDGQSWQRFLEMRLKRQ
jgi:hypothetical protein